MKMSITAIDGAPQSQQQVSPTPLDSQKHSTMKTPATATERSPHSQQKVPPTPLEFLHPSTMKMSTTATDGARQMKVILRGKIKDYVVSPISRQFTYMFDFNNNIKKLETELEELQSTRDLVQRGVNEGSRPQLLVSGQDAVTWLTTANEVTNQVEGIIVDKAKVKKGCLNGFCPNIKLRYSVSKEAVKNTKAVVDLEAAGFDYVKLAYRMPQVENFRALKSRRLNMGEISEENFKALKSQMLYMEEIIKALEQDQIDLIGICGMAGMGKTTMAKEVAKRAKENKLFDEVAMATVGQTPNLSKVQDSIAGMLGLTLGDPENPIVIATLLRQRLLQGNKKILVILDDIWGEFDLRNIGIPLGDANKNVKILYTSRVRDLWHDLQTKKEIPLELLSDDEAWQLFREKAGDLVDDQDFQPIAKQIMNECGRLPIALVLIGRTLFKKSKGIFIKDVWEKMLNELTCSRSTPVENCLSSTLELSYNYMEDEEARRLFLLCCFVEEEKSIHIEDLVRCAWGLSLFSRVNTMRKERHQVSALVDDLKRRYLLLDSENDKCVEVHEVVRDMGISIASKDKGVLVCHGAVSEWPKRDIYEHCISLSVISDRITELPERWTCPNLEFLLLECCKVEKLPSNFFEGKEKLKVLGLTNFDGILTLQSLGNLRTLSLKRFGGVLDNVSVMGGLVNLEILNFHGSSIKELPEEIGDLVNLRLLDLGDTWSLDKIPPGVISRLVHLEELYIFDSKFREWEGEGKEEEGINANLREFESLSNLNTLEIRIRCDVLIPAVPIFSELTTYKILVCDTGGCYRHIDQYKKKLFVSASSPIPSDRGWFDLLLRSTDCLILEGEGCKDILRDLLLRDGVDGLQQLKYLQISHCDTPECLANATNLVQQPNEPAPAVFPILEQLKLSALPNLREICRGPAPAGSFGELTDIDVDNCERLGHLFQLPIVRSLTQLKSLSIMRCDMMEEVICKQQREDVVVATNVIDFPKLETLVLDNLPSLVGFSREINGIDFPHAKCLRLRHLRHLRRLFANYHGFLSLFPQKVTFPSLELLELQGLQNLGDVWGGELLDFSFSKLKELEVEDCGSLTDLFHPSMVGGLVNLQKLVIKNCQKMNSVVGREEEIEEGQGRAIEKTLFPQLKVLEIHCLPNLSRFCYFTHPIESQLRRIYISDCPSMDAFSLGNVSIPNLSLPAGVSWNGNLNNAVQLLQEISDTATEGASQSEQQVNISTEGDSPRKSQQRSTIKMSATAIEGAPQSQHQDLPTALESENPSTMKMSTRTLRNKGRSKQTLRNKAADRMMHFFFEEPRVAHTGGFDGLLEAFRNLPEPLQHCLLCFFKFPPEATIKRMTMIYLWIGQGYTLGHLQGREDKEELPREEDAGNEIFDELIEKGFIEPIHQNCSLVPNSCRMSLHIRSSLSKEAGDMGFTSNGTRDLDLGFVCGGRPGHSCLVNAGEAVIHCEPQIFENMKHSQCLYLGRWQSSPTHHIELADSKTLHGLNKVKSLKFLSLRGISLITELPTLVLELNDLKILDLQACHNLDVIPQKIGLLKSLTHLDMSECYFLENMPKSLAQLSNLKVLKGFFIGDSNMNKKACTLRDLSVMPKLRKLNICTSLKDFPTKSDLEALQQFKGLQKLTISWGGFSFYVETDRKIEEDNPSADLTRRKLPTYCQPIEAASPAEAEGPLTLPPGLQKLDLQCFPTTTPPHWLKPAKLKVLKKLYIRGGKLLFLDQFWKHQVEQWNVEILRLKYLSELELDWIELRTIFPKLIYLHQVECPKFTNFPCDEKGVWMDKEAIDIHVQLQKYLRTSSIISSSSMSGSGPTLAQDESNICPVDEKQH